MSDDVWLFSYGTLQQDDVQIATFDRRLAHGTAAIPAGLPFRRSSRQTELASQSTIDLV